MVREALRVSRQLLHTPIAVSDVPTPRVEVDSPGAASVLHGLARAD